MLKVNELILMQIGTSCPRGKTMKRSNLRSEVKVQGCSYDAKDILGGLTVASFLCAVYVRHIDGQTVHSSTSSVTSVYVRHIDGQTVHSSTSSVTSVLFVI